MRYPLATLAAALACAALLGACDRTRPPATGITVEQFVDVVVELRRAAREYGDTAAYDARRQQVLRERAVTDSMLLEFVQLRGHDVAAMAAIWDSVASRLRRPNIDETVQ